VGQAAQVVLRSQPGQAHAASVARLELLADAVTEERIAQVAFTTAPQGVSVGELAEVTVQLPASAPGLLVPNAAVQRQAGQAGVWRLAAAAMLLSAAALLLLLVLLLLIVFLFLIILTALG
jgi:HlyD family secretion protein